MKRCLIINQYFVHLSSHVFPERHYKQETWDTAEKHLPPDKAEPTCVDGSVQADYEDVCKLNFPLLTRVEVSRFWLCAVNLLKIKCCSAAFKQWGVSVAWMHLSHPICICHIGWEVFIFLPQTGAWVSEERSGREEVLKWLLSPVPRFFISGEFRLWSPWQSVWKDQRGSMKYLHLEPLQHGRML